MMIQNKTIEHEEQGLESVSSLLLGCPCIWKCWRGKKVMNVARSSVKVYDQMVEV